MRPTLDHSRAAYQVRVPCIACDQMHKLADSVIDRDGPAFRAYYCPACQPVGLLGMLPPARCDRPGCARCSA